MLRVKQCICITQGCTAIGNYSNYLCVLNNKGSDIKMIDKRNSYIVVMEINTCLIQYYTIQNVVKMCYLYYMYMVIMWYSAPGGGTLQFQVGRDATPFWVSSGYFGYFQPFQIPLTSLFCLHDPVGELFQSCRSHALTPF